MSDEICAISGGSLLLRKDGTSYEVTNFGLCEASCSQCHCSFDEKSSCKAHVTRQLGYKPKWAAISTLTAER